MTTGDLHFDIGRLIDARRTMAIAVRRITFGAWPSWSVGEGRRCSGPWSTPEYTNRHILCIRKPSTGCTVATRDFKPFRHNAFYKLGSHGRLLKLCQASTESGSCGRLARLRHETAHFVTFGPETARIVSNQTCELQPWPNRSHVQNLFWLNQCAHPLKEDKSLYYICLYEGRQASIPGPACPCVYSGWYQTAAPALTGAVSPPAIRLGRV